MMDPKRQTLNVSAHYTVLTPAGLWKQTGWRKCRNTPLHTHSFTMTLCNKQPDLLRNMWWCWTQQHSFTMTCKKHPCTQLYHDTLQQADLHSFTMTLQQADLHSFTMTLCNKQTYLLQNTSWCWTPMHTALPWHFATSRPTYCKTCHDIEHPCTQLYRDTLQQADLLQNTSWWWTPMHTALPWHFATSRPTAKHVMMLNTHAHSFTMTLCNKQTNLLQNTWCWTQHPRAQFYHDTATSSPALPWHSARSSPALPWHFATSSPIFCKTCCHEQSWHTTRCDKATPTDSPHLKQLL